MENVFSNEIPELLQSHLDHLLKSGISIEVIKERGYKSVMGKGELDNLGFAKSQQRVPGILIPLYAPDGSLSGYQYRPDSPRIAAKGGRPIKYENPKGVSLRIDMPRRCKQHIGNPEIPLFVTEGAKKADSLATAGVCAINLSGVWGFKAKNEFGAPMLSADFDLVAWKGRAVYLCFDSDLTVLPQVRQALQVLGAHVQRKGAEPFVVQLPAGYKGEKTGVDDYMVQGHTIADLIALSAPLSIDSESADTEIYTAHFENEGQLWLEVRKRDGDYTFAHLEGDKVVLSGEFVIGGRTVKPRSLPQIEGQTIEIVGLPTEGITTIQLHDAKTLLERVKEFITRYVDLKQRDLELAAYYVLFTWFNRKVNTAAYLRFLADTGKGKTRAKRVAGDLCFCPIYAAGASSFSGIARTQQKWRGTLIIDEADFGGDKEAQLTKYLNLGFERGQYYILSDKKDPKMQDYFDPFGAKVIAMREPFNDNATEGRLLSITMRETHNVAIPIILDSDYQRDIRQLRDEIARFMITHWREVDGARMLRFDDLQIEPRLKQLAMPLSVIFQLWPEGVNGFRDYLTARQVEIRRQRAMSWQGMLVNTVITLASGNQDPGKEFNDYLDSTLNTVQAVTPSMVAQTLKATAKACTLSLRGIGFVVEYKRVKIFKDGEGKQRRTRAYVVPDSRTWAEIISRYWYSDDGTELPEIPDVLRSLKYVQCEEVCQPCQPCQTEPSAIDQEILVGTHGTHGTLPYSPSKQDDDVAEV
jgi:hypothetical protein